MSRPRIAIVVDHPQRDLPGLVLTTYRLWQAGVDAVLVPLNLLGAEVFAMVPDFVALNYLRRTIEPVMRGCVEAGIPYGVIETEGGLYGNLDNYLTGWTPARDLRDAARVMCVWGRRTRDYLVEVRALAPDQMVVTGVPRFDFYHRDWRPLFADEERFSERPLVLVNTKVAVANPQYHSVTREIDMYVERLGFPLAEVLRLRDVGQASIEATLELTNRLALAHQDLEFVLRPHPHERLSTYEDGIAPVPNLAVVRTGTVDRWLVESVALIHRHCTTAVEAGLAGVPALAPQWLPTAADAPDTELVSIRCGSRSELDDALDAVRRGEAITPADVQIELDRIVDDWLCVHDGRSNERVAEAVLAALPGERRPDARIAERHFFRLSEPLMGRRGAVGRLARGAATFGARRFWAGVAQPASRGWRATAKAYSVRDVAQQIHRVHALEEPGSPPPRVQSARELGVYRFGYAGHGVVVGR